MRTGLDQLHGLRALGGWTLLAWLLLASPALAGAPDLSGSVQLSNERTFTRWAHAVDIQPIREQPKPNAWLVGELSLNTEDGLPEVYLLLRSWTDPAGVDWLQIRVPMRPKTRTGWVQASALGPAQMVRTQLVVNRGRLRAILFRGGRRVLTTRIGIGKKSTPTPGGRFWVRERIRARNPRGPYGPWAFGTSAYSRLSDWPGGGVVGIHGTDQPELIPGRPSHGCIRVPNPAIRRLARLMPIGTPVWVE
jgi:hypothetical protein